MIAIHCRGSQKTWDEHIPHLMFALRTARQETTGFSPAYLNLGRELRAPNEAFSELADANRAPFEPSAYHKALTDRLTNCYDSARKRMRQASERQARYFNLKRRNVEFPVGAVVWKRNHALSDAAKSRSAKLEPKFIGPFKVLRKESPTVYRLGTLRGKEAGAGGCGVTYPLLSNLCSCTGRESAALWWEEKGEFWGRKTGRVLRRGGERRDTWEVGNRGRTGEDTPERRRVKIREEGVVCEDLFGCKIKKLRIAIESSNYYTITSRKRYKFKRKRMGGRKLNRSKRDEFEAICD
ncbi:hypothetical protein J437_LFUL002695 [Ladona fulva]|uniref:Uncharacterized protein n=1 Tax=Ladona fulva TaxID=123851 RepID=A0A8K0NY95_LADFU|nr:hypothetical protein J437_LFUL002695 [Ladona fulva]